MKLKLVLTATITFFLFILLRSAFFIFIPCLVIWLLLSHGEVVQQLKDMQQEKK